MFDRITRHALRSCFTMRSTANALRINNSRSLPVGAGSRGYIWLGQWPDPRAFCVLNVAHIPAYG
jgi:hypothetical protein